MIRIPFDREKEIQNYIENNIELFFGNVIFLPGDFYIYTPNDKKAKPDGFIIDLHNSTWTILETERMEHGVWRHIGEQLMRFIVASNNGRSHRIVRDKFFQKIRSENSISSFSRDLNIPESELITTIEKIIENEPATIALVIDDMIDDLKDGLDALNANFQVFVVDKFDVNGNIEYHIKSGASGENTPMIETTVDTVGVNKGRYAPALSLLGDYMKTSNIGPIKFYIYENGDKIRLIYSKDYENRPFWYGITAVALKHFENENLTHLVFILGTEGIVKVPIDVVKKYLNTAGVSKNKDGSVKHWHVLISSGEEHIMFTNSNTPEYDLDSYFYPFN